MALVWHAAALMNIASGVLMAVLGAALLLANPRKDWNRVFALLAVFWGAQIVATNAVRVTSDPGAARLAGEVGLAFLLPLYFFLVVFVAIFPRPRPPLGSSGLAVALLTLPAGLTLAVLFLAPGNLIASVRPTPEGGFTLLWGPLLPWLVTAPFFGAVFYALFTMMRRLDEAASAIERKQITFVLAALALFAAHVTPLELATFGAAALQLDSASEAGLAEARLFAVIMLGGLVLLAGLAAKLLARARRAAGEAERREARLMLGAVGVGFLSALLVAGLAAAGGPQVEVLGLVRFGSVGLVVYAIARYQLFDLDLRMKGAAALATALLAGLALAAAAWIALQQASVPASVGTVAAALAAMLAFVPLLRVAARLADRVAPQVSRAGDHLYLRKLEVYRASVEQVLQQGREPSPDAPELAELRARLGLTPRDHGVVVSLAVSRAEPRRGAPDLRPGGVAFGKYAVEAVLAEGGFGRVVLARDRLLDRPVVIKELQAKWRGHPAVVRTFLREARIAGQLNHPHIVAVYEVEQHGEDYYIVMEHLPGGSLAERLEGGKLPLPEALRVARAVLRALAAAHARGVVHRDVKPANVLFGHGREAKLADFGIAQLAGEDQERTISGLTSAAPQPGTLQYMSPEQARGKPVDARSDLYAVGALLYRMLAGRPHMDLAGMDELSARNAVASAPPPSPIPGVPPGLNAMLARALALEPERRFASADEFEAALGELAEARGGSPGSTRR